MVWSNVPKHSVTIGGDSCWRGNGVSVYKPNSEWKRRTIVPHRFAINLPQAVAKARIKTDRYYIHVYQTKIGTQRWTLRSKEMVQEMQSMFKKVYYPRDVDTQSRRQRSPTAKERKSRHGGGAHKKRNVQSRPVWKMHNPTEKSRRPEGEPTSFQFQEVMSGLHKLTAAVERLVDN